MCVPVVLRKSFPRDCSTLAATTATFILSQASGGRESPDAASGNDPGVDTPGSPDMSVDQIDG